MDKRRAQYKGSFYCLHMPLRLQLELARPTGHHLSPFVMLWARMDVLYGPRPC